MRRTRPDHAVHRAVAPRDHHSLRRAQRHRHASKRRKVHKAVIVHVHHYEADLVAVALDHHRALRAAVQHAVQVAVHVDRGREPRGGPEPAPDEHHAGLLAAGGRGKRHELLQKLGLRTFKLHLQSPCEFAKLQRRAVSGMRTDARSSRPPSERRSSPA